MACNPMDAQTEALVADLEECALDPTLDQCCRRDIQEQIGSAKIRGQLRSVDRVEAALRTREGVIVRDVLKHPQEAHADDTDDEDATLTELRQKRLQQLQQDARAAEERRRAGSGQLRDIQQLHLTVSYRKGTYPSLLGLQLLHIGHTCTLKVLLAPRNS
jgi:hypothetical protein